MSRSGVRDLASCDPNAGAVPCDLVDMTHVSTPGHFYVKVNELVEKHLKQHCNKVRHHCAVFESMTIKFKSLTLSRLRYAFLIQTFLN